MLNALFLAEKPSQDWDHPLLAGYAEREIEAEQSEDSEDALSQSAVMIWREALVEHPELAGSYLRLASALRDADRFEAAANVLRSGVAAGHTQLLLDLLLDYPSLATHDELTQGVFIPTCAAAALFAMVSQKKTDLALTAFHQAIATQSDALRPPFSAEESHHLIELLVQSERLSEARGLHEKIAQLSAHQAEPTSKSHLLGEVLSAGSWLSVDQRAALMQLLRSGNGRGLAPSLRGQSTRQVKRFFQNLKLDCPRLSANYNSHLQEIERALTQSSLPVRLLLGILFLVICTAFLWSINAHSPILN